MLIVFHSCVHLFAGALFAHATSRSNIRAYGSAVWRLTAALYVDLLAIAPLIAYQVRLWPAYAFGYAVDPLLSPWVETQAPYIAFAALVAMPLSFTLGFALCTFAAQRGRRLLSLAVVLAAATAAAAWMSWHYEEFTVIADFPTYWRGGGTWASRHVHVQLLGLAYAVTALVLWGWRRRALNRP